jgi:hypothetical protein
MMQQPLYLADEAFDLLAVRVPHELQANSQIENFDEAIGMTREQFAAFLRAISGEGRTSGWADPQTTATLRNALAVVLLELNSGDFKTRVGYTQEEATELLTQLNTYLRKGSEEAN